MESDIIVANHESGLVRAAHISMCREVCQLEREFDRKTAVAMFESIGEELEGLKFCWSSTSRCSRLHCVTELLKVI